MLASLESQAELLPQFNVDHYNFGSLDFIMTLIDILYSMYMNMGKLTTSGCWWRKYCFKVINILIVFSLIIV